MTFSHSLYARDTGISGTNLEFYHPSIDAFGYFGVESPHLLSPGEFSFKLSQSLGLNHIFLIAVNGAPIDLVDHILTTNAVASVGISSFLEVGLDVPFHLYLKEADFNTLGSFTTRSLGDLRMTFKFRLLEEKEQRPGLALLVTNTFPTGDENKFVGTSHMVPGVNLVVGKTFKYFDASINVGAQFPQQKNVIGQNFDDQVTYGAAMRVPFTFWDPNLSVVGEVRGHLEPNDIQIVTAPVEFTAGLEKKFRNGLKVSAGGGGAWNNAIGNPRIRGLVSIGYTPSHAAPWKVVRKLKTHEPIREKQIQTTAYFGLNSSLPSLESSQWILEAARRIQEHPDIRNIRVIGYTDGSGPHGKNLHLSIRRAQSVKNLMVREGVDPERIQIEGRDGDEPVAGNETKSGRRLNRRVEISISQ